MLKIRLRQQGRKNQQTYRLVVTDVRRPRDGKYIEMLGWYNPFDSKKDCAINEERTQYWLKQGAQPTPRAHVLLKRVAKHLVQ
jgi:small subunit ribosomal protein S16